MDEENRWSSDTPSEGHPARVSVRVLIIPLLIFGAWVVERSFLGGSVFIFRDEDLGKWVAFTAISEILVGILVTGFALRTALREGWVTCIQIGVQFTKTSMIGIFTAGSLGIALFFLPGWGKVAPSTAFHLFFVLLPLATGEVMVCWALLGTHIETILVYKGTFTAALISQIAAVVFSGIPYCAGIPLAQAPAVVFPVLLAGLLTGCVFLIFRDIYATITIHIFALMVINIQTAAATLSSTTFIPVLITAAMATFCLLFVARMLIRASVT
jgi:hypothetical protein